MAKIKEIDADSILARSSHYGPLKPSMLYNAMINPITKFNIKGTIWYQGEANVKRQENYEELFSLLINDWRQSWGYDFPFYYVQIAPYHYYNKNSAYLREAQFNVMQKVNNTGMVSTLDIGDWGRIHPGHKKEIGERLAYWALVKDYGFEGVTCDAPHYDYLEVKDTLALVYFKGEVAEANIEQLDNCFEVAGEDSVFYPAKAQIREWKNFAEVWSDKVSKPVAVRYCFKKWTIGKMFGTNELPVSSFRTDDWDNK
jgi:sialate O-acetylesterase